MPEPPPLNLLRLFDFYLALMLVAGLVRRWEVYWDAVRLIVAVRGRWPRLMQQLGEHQSLLLNGAFFRPVLLALLLTVVQMVCSRLIWSHAVLTGADLRAGSWWLPLVVLTGLPMLAVDAYFLLRVGRFDRAETAKYLDQAETWLGWRGPLVRAATLGMVNPRRMVDDEVKKSLAEIGTTVRSSLWWVSAQITCRVMFGLTLWTVWAVS